MPAQDRPLILLVEDLDNWREVTSAILKADNDILMARAYDEAKQILQLRGSRIDLVIADISLNAGDRMDEGGMLLLEYMGLRYSWISTIVLTGYPSFKTIRKAFKDLQVFDYIEKRPDEGFDLQTFRDLVRRAVQATREQREAA